MAERTTSSRSSLAALGTACALLLACSSTSSATHETTGGAVAQGGATGGAVALGGAASGGTHAGGDSANAGAAGAPVDSECALAAHGVEIYAGWDPFGYPLYTLDGCNLAYVAPDGSLHWRDLSTLDDQVLDGSESVPRRPSLRADVLTWEVVLDGKSQVRVHTSAGTTTLSGDFDHAAEPKAARDAVVFTAFSAPSPTSDTDVFLYDVASDSASVALGGPGQQRFADISDDFVAASDFSEDPRGYFDEISSLADIVLLSRTDGSVISRPLPGKQAFPMLGKDGLLAYLHWGDVHPEPKLVGFALFVASVNSTPAGDTFLRDIHTKPSYVRPSVRGTVIDFIDFIDFIEPSSSRPALYRAPLSPLGAPVLVAEGSSVERLLSPVGTEAWTVVGKQLASGTALEVWAR